MKNGAAQPKGAAATLLEWYRQNKRDLPWRDTQEPYCIWVSEIIMQQTRVEVGRGYYERFIARYPDVGSLAHSDMQELNKLWEGLGYYARARRMREAAQILVRDHAGVFPKTAKGLLALPGIGPYTAGAIASICYGERAAAVDGNVLRVMARYVGVREPIERPAVKRAIQEGVLALMPKEGRGDFNQALMELGATVCVPSARRCPSCPWQEGCDALAQGDAQDLPQRAAKKAKQVQAMHVAVICHAGAVLVRKREDEGLLAGLWELPHGLSAAQRGALGLRKIKELTQVRHAFTHKVWQMRGTQYEAKRAADLGAAYRWVTAQELMALPLPSAMATWRDAAWEALM